jgi:hypothetical protein
VNTGNKNDSQSCFEEIGIGINCCLCYIPDGNAFFNPNMRIIAL